MDFIVKKTANCFVDCETWEYSIPIDGEQFASTLDDGWTIRRNTRLRRPVFVAERDGTIIKGVLAAGTIRVSYPEKEAAAKKIEFEARLASL